MDDSGSQDGGDAQPELDLLSTLPRPTTAEGVRDRLLDMMRRDLVGPCPDRDPDLAREVLAGASPSTFYLTGFLGPRRGAGATAARAPARASGEGAAEDQAELRLEEQRGSEAMEQGATGRGVPADEGANERPPSRSFEPSSLGLTVLLPEGARALEARVTWGDYVTEPPLDEAVLLPARREAAIAAGERPQEPRKETLAWRRIPREERVTISLDAAHDGETQTIDLWDSAAPQVPGGCLRLVVSARPTRTAGIDGVRRDLLAVSVFLVNARPEAVRRFGDVAFAFQARLELTAASGFAPRDDRASYHAQDFDARLADLHYRDVASYAVGHNTSGDWAPPDAEGRVTRVFTNPIPVQDVEKLGADLDVAGVERGMERLAEAALDPDALAAVLDALPADYARWATGQAAAAAALDGARRQEIARECLANVEAARARIAGGISHLLADPLSREAFAIANRVMARANIQRAMAQNGQPPKKSPSWRLFQLAFVLLNLEGLASPAHPDRPIVDLLFFPTGGGKTEAYLGLAAFAIARRRLANPGLAGAGLSVVMRYTLRLLTLDQLQRAAGLVCALELERQEKGRLGTWPIEIGLWVGGGATPNTFGSSKSPKEGTAVRWLQDHRKGGPAPAPVKDCPWCGTPLRKDSFHIHPNVAAPQRLDITCDGLERGCPFTGKQRLPVVVVDDEIYRRLPAFMIATVDKFAGVPWEGRSGAFFGHVGRADDRGFYGAEERTAGRPLEAELRPIDLVIQDELHLISGPLGTVAGLYETAFDLLSSRRVDGVRRGPKIVASTATVRRADAQIRNLFGRDRTAIFPPPGVGRDDSFFAKIDRDTPSRLYVGIASPGRGPKLVFLRTLQTLLAGAQALSTGAEGDPADPYLTALCYFNALRELGGARRIVDDEVRTHLTTYGVDRVRRAPEGRPFADRVLREIQELTSRYSTDKVSEARTRLGLPVRDRNAVDVAMATNMISVGLDIGRLGLMVVQGQPKTAAEYIQATSRVGRMPEKPGLVVTLLNIHKPRDRTHYEQFRAFHMSFYRAVEATSVTPFAGRALDRALAATLVAGTRHVEPALTPQTGAERLAEHVQAFDAVKAIVAEKMGVAGQDAETMQRCLTRLDELRDAWIEIADRQTRNGDAFVYGKGDSVKRLLQEPLSQGGNITGNRTWFEAGRSMRDTEPVSLLKLRSPDGAAFEN